MSRRQQLERTWRLLVALDGSAGASASELARRLGVSLRTVYRDLEALQAVDFPLYTDKTGREAA